MREVTFKVNSKSQSFPFGTVGGNWAFAYGSQGESAATDKLVTPNPMATFSLEDGAYWVIASRQDADGQPLGSTARAEFVLEPNTVMIEVADTISISLGAPA